MQCTKQTLSEQTAHSEQVAMETTLAGHYQIVRHLGGGGFGQTFLAKDIHLPGFPLCVVKQLKPTVDDAAHLITAQRLFNQEAETLYRLGCHDQIPRLLAHFEQDGEFYLVQEYVEGQPLNREIRPGSKLSEAYTIAMLQDILQVLAFVHQQYVIHRDIKPANLIRRNRDCKIVLIDFGAVKEVRSNTLGEIGTTTMTVAIGSPGYMPTEQQAFKPHFSSDIYAVGMVCLEALTGLKPKNFPRDRDSGEVSCALLGNEISISPEFAAVLDKMVRYDYRQRYPDAIAALQALQHMLGQANPHWLPQDEGPTATHTLGWSNETAATSPPPNEIVPPLVTDSTPAGSLSGSTSSSTSATQLSGPLKTGLAQLLAGVIGPIAPVVIKKAMKQATSSAELIELLTMQLPVGARSPFRRQALQLIQDLGDPFTAISGPPTQQQEQSIAQSATGLPGTTQPPTTSVDLAFAKRCEQELAKAIGPIATLLVKRTLAKNPGITQPELIETLTKHLPNAAAIATFRQSLILRP